MEKLQQIKKRDGRIVEFDASKITLVIQKAFMAVRGVADEDLLKRITQRVVAELEVAFPPPERIPTVEVAQDIVEKNIMQEGYFDVAKAYIIYRYEHFKEREEKKKEVLQKIEGSELMVEKRSGIKEQFSMEKIKQALGYAARGYEEEIDIDMLANQCRTEVYDNISTQEISRALVMATRSFTELDPAYSKVAARLLFSKLYKEVIGQSLRNDNLDALYRKTFIDRIREAVDANLLDKHMLEFDLEKLSSVLKPERDDLFRYLGAQTLYDRYFLQIGGSKSRIFETPQAFWMRVAMGLAIGEKDKTEWATRFYEVLSTFRYVPSTPTLLHAGMKKAQLASCFLNTVGDDLKDIFKSYSDNAQLLKWSGGMGTDWTSVRGTGALIKEIGVESQGIIPFLKIANDVTISINRSGRRRGAGCVYLETWHYDIEEFLELRKNTGDERRRTHDINTANWIPDLFMRRVREDGNWTLFSPDETPELHEIYGKVFEEKYVEYERKADEGQMRLWKRIKARDIWKKMLAMLFETGHPWVTFKDPSNIRSPQDHVGVVHNSNLCTEITLNTSQEETAVCNLGWVNFAEHVSDGQFDEEKVAETVKLGIRMLDNVIDGNFYPTPETRTSNIRHRPIGLGMGGFHDALYKLGIHFDSEVAVEFADYSMEVISWNAFMASSSLAQERGAYQSFKGSKWDRGILPLDSLNMLEKERGERIPVNRKVRLDWNMVREAIQKNGMRNSNCLAVAPTASTSNIVGSIPSIEPIYKNIYVKANMSGDFVIVNPYLVEDLKRLRLWNKDMLSKLKFHDGDVSRIPGIPEDIKEKYKEVFQINPKWLIRAAAHRGKWVDQSQALNIFFTGSSGKQLAEIYMYAWEMGLKTTYYLRTLAASQVEKSTVNIAEFGSTHTRKRVEDVSVTEAEKVPEPVAVVVGAGSEHSKLAKESSSSVSQKPYVAAYADSFAQGVVMEESVAVKISSSSLPENLPLCKIDDPDCESCQ